MNVCRTETLQQFCDERCNELAADEYGPPIEEVKGIYDKFMDAVRRYASAP
jgi:hypothetical protein